MLIYEKLSRKPGTFRRLTGVGGGVFSEMAGKTGPLWEKGGTIMTGVAEIIPCPVLKTTFLPC
ncbi:hypothetical protein DENIS_3439 [Desulfonema ishimotonii]|uniref:Uncharacterized protein n=1 Tax=Desulfonema ishimotonii TaxID=45657 RepID=A0A401FZU6_9BACT|nr:hypothetical protein [Desulfonema ishimotonii]GBC62467.1 hypothetical protein DENIS_3439 [Desulfonema ishimotonii]